jgi:hypothetical protein
MKIVPGRCFRDRSAAGRVKNRARQEQRRARAEPDVGDRGVVLAGVRSASKLEAAIAVH